MTRDEAVALIDRLYASAHGEAGWTGTLALLADRLGHIGANLELHDVADGRLIAMEAAGLDPGSVEVYNRDFAHRNPRSSYLKRNPNTCISHDHMLMSEREMDRHPFYADFLAPSGLRYYVALQAPIDENGRILGVVAVQRGGSTAGVDQETVRLMDSLRPHIARAMRVYWNRSRTALDPDWFDRSLAQFRLTGAERNLARAVVLGETLRAYAARCGVSINTVYTHYQRVKHKLDCRTQLELSTRLTALTARHPNP